MQYDFVGSPKPNKSVAVITPTIGKKELFQAVESVQKQSHPHITHYLVADGPGVSFGRWALPKNVKVCRLPINTGANGFYGHRIYSAFPHLVNEDYIAFLDEDNWYEPNHIESLVKAIEFYDWAHSLRKVYLDDKFHALDQCEAIGRWPVGWNDTQYLVDTSCYMFKREFLINVSQLWHHGWGGDRRFFMLIKDKSNYTTTGEHTLCYRLPDMNKAYGGQLDIFERYNKEVEKKYGGFPWIEKE